MYVDDQLLRDVFADPSAVASFYARDPERFRALIESDAEADDVVALQHRRVVVARIREWLADHAAFDAAAAEAKGPERAWQALLEDNPWIPGWVSEASFSRPGMRIGLSKPWWGEASRG